VARNTSTSSTGAVRFTSKLVLHGMLVFDLATSTFKIPWNGTQFFDVSGAIGGVISEIDINFGLNVVMPLTHVDSRSKAAGTVTLSRRQVEVRAQNK
jgi:hypothetical protein